MKTLFFALLICVGTSAVAMQGGSSSNVSSTDFVITTPSGSCASK